MASISTHRFLQLFTLVDVLEAKARTYFRCASRADSIKNGAAARHFRARGTKCLRVAQIAALRAGL